MIIGIPKEIKENETRVAIVPSGVRYLTHEGHTVLVQKNAGVNSGISDKEYQEAGAKIIDSSLKIFKEAELVVKVKEILPSEYGLLQEDQLIFTYFHFAADRELTETIIKSKCIAIAYETVQASDGKLPLLTPMSEIAGKMSIQIGARCLEKPFGGKGMLLGGVPGVAPAEVLILGAGVVGINAAKIAAGLGAKVTLLDINLERLRYLSNVMPANVTLLMSNYDNIIKNLVLADLVVGAVLIPGAKAPVLITREMIKMMKPNSVIVDIAIDQGGCIETSHPTSYSNPTYVVDGVTHCCIANVPSAVPWTSTFALTNATFSYIATLAKKGLKSVIKENPALKKGINIYKGKVVNPQIAKTFGFECHSL